MDLFALMKVVLRHWLVVVPTLLATLALALYVHTETPPEYEATGWLVLQDPALDPSKLPASAVNPVELANNLEGPDDEAVEFTVSELGGNSYSVVAAAGEAAAATGTVDRVIDQVGQAMTRVQTEQGIPTEEQLELRRTSPQPVAEELADGTHSARATVYVHDPAQQLVNPYPANGATVRLLQVGVTGDAGRARFASLSTPGTSFEVAQAPRDPAPLFQVVTTGSDEAAVLEAFYHVQTIVSEDLEERQARAQVLPSRRVTVGVLSAPLGVTDVSPPVARATVGVVGLGGLLAFGLALALENLATRRREHDAATTTHAPDHTMGEVRASTSPREFATRNARPEEVEDPVDPEVPADASTVSTTDSRVPVESANDRDADEDAWSNLVRAADGTRSPAGRVTRRS